MDFSAPSLPLLRINERHVLRIKNNHRLKTMSERFFSAGGFNIPTHIIDYNMRKYKIISISKRRLSLYIFDVIGYIEGKFWFVVDFKLSDPVQLSFDEVKFEIIELVVRKRWYAQGGQNKKQFVDEFESFTNMQELLSNISAYGNPPF